MKNLLVVFTLLILASCVTKKEEAKLKASNKGLDAKGKTPQSGTLDALVETGKTKGFLTYDEINEAIPQNNFSVEDMDSFLETLGGLGVDVVDINPYLKYIIDLYLLLEPWIKLLALLLSAIFIYGITR